MSSAEGQQLVRVEQIAQLRLLTTKTVKEISETLGISQPYIYKLMNTPEYAAIESRVRGKFSEVTGEFLDNMTNAVKKLMPIAIARLEDELMNSLDPKMIRWAVDSVLDRGGVVKQSRIENRHVITLSPETIQALASVQHESDVIDLRIRDWSYATTRPVDERRQQMLGDSSSRLVSSLEGNTSKDESPETVDESPTSAGIEFEAYDI